MGAATETRTRSLARLLPILVWLPRYDRTWLRGDVLAGIAVTAMIVPKDLGYAGIAGVPVQNGLYAAAAGALVYALFCTSRHISTGPSSSLAAVAGGAVLVTGVAGPDAAELVVAITLVTGALFLLVALLRAGWIARFLSRAVVIGFLAGAAIDVVVGELPKLTGTSASGETVWAEFGSWVRGLGDVSGTTLVVGLLALGAILALRFSAPQVPGALVLVVGGLLATWAFDLGAHGVALVGEVPRGLPAPDLPGTDVFREHYATILAAATGLLLIGFSQTAGDAREFAARHRYRIDVNQESVAQGMANVAAGTFQGMPVSTSLSASSLNESAGARTPMASLVTGGLVLLTLVALAPLFSDLPKAVLGAIIIDAVVFGMIDVPGLRRLYRVKRFDFWIAVAAFLGVLSAGVLTGVVVGIALSLLWLVYVATAPGIPTLGREPGTQVFRDLDEHPGDETIPGVAVVRLDGGLFFATAEALQERVRALVQEDGPPTRAVVLDLEAVSLVDSQGAAQLTEILELADSREIDVHLACAKPAVAAVLERDGVLGRLGPERVHATVHGAVDALAAAPPAGLPATIEPRWEWRTFGDSFGPAEEAFAALTAERVDESDDLYLLTEQGDASLKVRDGLMDVKHLRAVDDDGLEQWAPVLKRAFPLTDAELAVVLGTLRVAAPPLDPGGHTLDELLDEVVRPGGVRAVRVHKHRAHYTVGGCMAEVSEVRTEGASIRTIAVESEDPARVLAAVRSLGLASRVNVNMARGLKALVGVGTRRYAVIDVGTNSVKLHIGELRADGTWRAIADRAEVSRLGEGVDAAGRLGEEPMKRTAEAIAAMADESRRFGAVAIAAVGTAGLRAAANGAEFLAAAVEARCGVRIEIIPGDEEGRLAYLAAVSAVDLARGSLVVFDTGGGSSQFTFGRAGEVDEQFSVPVGAVRLTERYGLDGAVSEQALAEALSGIGAELACLDGRTSPDALVGMGGALTNLAAVKHGLAAYDPDLVQGTRLDRAEIDRQIGLYRTRTADERRAIVGLQQNRAEVILAGACVVRTVLTKLGCDSLVVSDRGLRHGLIVDRFGVVAPPLPHEGPG